MFGYRKRYEVWYKHLENDSYVPIPRQYRDLGTARGVYSVASAHSGAQAVILYQRETSLYSDLSTRKEVEFDQYTALLCNEDTKGG